MNRNVNLFNNIMTVFLVGFPLLVIAPNFSLADQPIISDHMIWI